MKIPIVNEQDEVIGMKNRNEILPTDIIRISVCWVINKKNEMLLVQRASNKLVHPNKWSSSCVGTNEEGETYESNMAKELTEELGILNPSPTFLNKIRIHDTGANYFASIFVLPGDYTEIDLKIQTEELQAIRFISGAELATLVEKQKELFTPGFFHVFDFFKNNDLIKV